ncbi:YARHG domain-containing protein [Rhodoblastus acidophilus]|nr:YARHG domain-containing protein [Rhodoblastus acidophilus]RAI17189.1 YARHG domain-containing protein [Rhodoblastus acidophilus]
MEGVMGTVRHCVLVAALAASPAMVAPSAALAQAPDPAYMSCGELWHARNKIYARNGYCFKSARAIAVFGEGCFPPYGQLGGWEKDRVDELQMWEARKGC